MSDPARDPLAALLAEQMGRRFDLAGQVGVLRGGTRSALTDLAVGDEMHRQWAIETLRTLLAASDDGARGLLTVGEGRR